MKISDIKGLKDGEIVDLKVMVLSKKDGMRYKVFDKTGEIWIESANGLEEGCAYKIKGVYKGGIVFVEEFEVIENPRPEDFLPVSPTIERDEERFWNLVEKIEDPRLKDFVRIIFEPIWEIFKKGVAAKRYHHAYIGGLLQHTANVAEIVYNLSKFYGLNTDIALLGALFHDLGKVWEFKVMPKFEHDEYYIKFGHIFLSATYIRDKAKEFGIPRNVVDEVIHIILAHHGEYSKGSPVSPKTLEALLVHLVDNLDAQINHMMMMNNEKNR